MTAPEGNDVTSQENIEEIAADEFVAVEDPEVVSDIEAAAAPAPIVFDRPIQTVGRRKEAVARVRLSRAPADSSSTAAPSRITSRTRCTSS